uniref:Reverse transcriptase zinc-binding domain-containing protein n=1 Tax=Setaria viridis TaxID=4556 RepID=A0A4U6TFC4_SETVI|nr:hypothetical protein SEVIR_8G031528v2 [Setaria viridis]
MYLDTYTCVLCILQEKETMPHLFLRCNFSKACWSTSSRPPFRIFNSIKDKLNVPFYMEIIILMARSIWSVRNDWTFQQCPPSVQSCKRKFMEKMNTVCLHRAKSSLAPTMMEWL